MTTDYDLSVSEKIDRLHEEAEALSDRAKVATLLGETHNADVYRRRATGKVREAARLRKELDDA